jgi:hypothetical protein
MFRTAAAALTLTLLVVSPSLAADHDAAVRTATTAIGAPLHEAAVADTDWLLRPVEFKPATRGGALPVLYVSLAALNALDAYTTSKGLSLGASESNPMMRVVAGNQAMLWAVKGSATTGSIVVAERLWRSHHKGGAVAVMLVTNGMLAVVSARNAGVLGQQR